MSVEETLKLANQTEALLQQLRDIHYPSPISWWPLAPGWYLLIALLGVLFFLIIRLLYKRWCKVKKQKIILQKLNDIKIKVQQNPFSEEVVQPLALLLKQVSLLLYPRQQVSGLCGQAWLEFLNRTGKTELFTSDIGRLLISAPYQARPPAELAELVRLVENWIKNQLKKKL